MSAEDVDDYLRGVEEPERTVLQTLRRTILEIVPEAEQVISYRVPAFRVGGKTVAGFAAFKTHLSYLPFSGSVLGQLAGELDGYTMTKSALHFSVDSPLPKALVTQLVAVRLAETDDFQRLDRVLSQLAQLLDAPGLDADGSAEPLWQKLDVFYKSMGADALRALLRRQGMSSNAIDDALNGLERRRGAMS